jgi:hypothetical protein
MIIGTPPDLSLTASHHQRHHNGKNVEGREGAIIPIVFYPDFYTPFSSIFSLSLPIFPIFP